MSRRQRSPAIRPGFVVLVACSALALWIVSDELWQLVEPLLPKKERRFRYPGRSVGGNLSSLLLPIALGGRRAGPDDARAGALAA